MLTVARARASMVVVVLALVVGCVDVGPREEVPPDLLLAVEAGSVGRVKSLLAEGADPNEQTTQGTTALIWAVGAGDPGLVEALLGGGAKPVAFYANSSLLTRAARLAKASKEDGFVQVVQLLVVAGADPCAVDVEGEFVGVRASVIAERRGRSALAAALAEAERPCPPS